MNEKINVKIFGNINEILGSCSKKGCSGSCTCNSGCSQDKTCKKAYDNLKLFLEQSDVKDKFILEFIEVDSKAILNYEELREYIKEGYTTPYIIIDGVFRYYGGISNNLVYNDIKELTKNK